MGDHFHSNDYFCDKESIIIMQYYSIFKLVQTSLIPKASLLLKMFLLACNEENMKPFPNFPFVREEALTVSFSVEQALMWDQYELTITSHPDTAGTMMESTVTDSIHVFSFFLRAVRST